MARKSRDAVLSDVHSLAMAQFNRIQTAQYSERQQCLDDRRFYSIAGAMWEGAIGQQWANRPRYEINKIQKAVNAAVTEYRNNRFTVKFINKDGTPASRDADVCQGLFRADEQDSVAQNAYDNAFEEAVGGGMGAFRLRADYEDEDDEREYQRIKIEPIFDADISVFFDLDAKKIDKSDAMHCFVLYSQTREAFEAEWGYDATSMPRAIGTNIFDWCPDNLVYIAEYYVIEKVRDVVVTYRHLDGSTEDVMQSALDDDAVEDFKVRGARKVGERKMRSRRVRKYLISGDRILEDCGHIPGKCIPIVPMYGKRWFVQGIERCSGLVRPSRDTQQIKNMQISMMAELSAYSAREKPIFLPEQIAGHEMRWARDNVDQYPFQLINPITDAQGNTVPTGPVGMTTVPQIPPAMAGLLQITEQDMQDILGSSPDMERMVSNISGRAVEQIQERVDARSFIFMDNAATAFRRAGEIWKSMASDVYVEEGRRLKRIGEMGDTSSVELMKPIMSEDRVVGYEGDLSKTALFDVAVSIGPSSDSKRKSTHRSVMEMMAITQDPQTLKVLQAMAFLNMDGEGLTDIQAYFRRQLVDAGVVPPNDEERMEIEAAAANQQPDPQQQALLAYAEAETAKAAQARANTMLTIVNAEKARAEKDRTEAQTVQILTETGLQPDRFALDAATALQRGINSPAAPQPA